MAAPYIPNKFQLLLSSPDVKPYTPAQRQAKTLVINEDYFRSSLLTPLTQASKKHIEMRIASVKSRASDTESFVVECLLDPHFRKQRAFGPSKEEIALKIKNALSNREKLCFVALMFTRKNICPLKRPDGDESGADFAEILSLVHLNSFAAFINNFYPYGVKYYLLSEGKRFVKAFDLCLPAVLLYQKKMKRWIKDLGLNHLELVDYEDFLEDHLADKDKKRRRQTYGEALQLYRSLMIPLLNPLDMNTTLSKAIELDPIIDSRNRRNNFIPLWDSIKNSLPYPEIAELAKKRGSDIESKYKEVFGNILNTNNNDDIEKVRESVIIKSWNAAIEHNARIMGDVKAGIYTEKLLGPNAFRTTINPKPGSSYLGIYSIRETTSRVQPWHGTAYLETDGVGRIIGTALTKLEIESRGGIPVQIEGFSGGPFFYANDAVATILKEEITPQFNLNTRL